MISWGRGLPLAPADLFEVEARLSAEERQARQAVSRFVSQRFLPLAQRHFREGTFPREIVPELGALGLFGMSLSGHGCPGLSQVAFGAAMQELERGDSGLRAFASVQDSLCMYPIHAFGSEEQKARFLPRLRCGEIVGCFALTEPEPGLGGGGMRTRARRSGGDYLLAGSKTWVANGSLADVAVVWARVDPDDPRSARAFLVEKGTPGMAVREASGRLSLRASVTSELQLDEVRVPARNLLPGTEALGLRAALRCLDRSRFGVAWGAVGAALACFEAARDYAADRVRRGRPFAGLELARERLVDMWEAIVQGQLLALRLGELADRGRMGHLHLSMGERANVRMAREVARSARDILGASGTADDYPVVRHLMNLEAVHAAQGAGAAPGLSLGRAATGLDAFS